MSEPPDPDVGLCARCRHARRVETRRGAVYVLCRLSESDSSFERYPRLPRLSCDGYEPEEVQP